jgi:hypothetical protein
MKAPNGYREVWVLAPIKLMVKESTNEVGSVEHPSLDECGEVYRVGIEYDTRYDAMLDVAYCCGGEQAQQDFVRDNPRKSA